MKSEVKRAFTLVEVMIAVATIAVLAAVAIPNFIEYRRSSHIGTCKANLKSILQAIEAYQVKTGRDDITDIQTLCREETRYLRSEPKCPVGGEYKITSQDGVFSVGCTAFDEETHNVKVED